MMTLARMRFQKMNFRGKLLLQWVVPLAPQRSSAGGADSSRAIHRPVLKEQ
jgi:hypothetical protein